MANAPQQQQAPGTSGLTIAGLIFILAVSGCGQSSPPPVSAVSPETEWEQIQEEARKLSPATVEGVDARRINNDKSRIAQNRFEMFLEQAETDLVMFEAIQECQRKRQYYAGKYGITEAGIWWDRQMMLSADEFIAKLRPVSDGE